MGKTKAIIVTSIVFSCTLLLSGNMVLAESGQDKETLSQIEQRLFMRTYDKDSPTARLERIEKNVFGQPVEGAFAERLGKVNEVVAASRPAAPPPADPDVRQAGGGRGQP
jgi:hypothetical protein